MFGDGEGCCHTDPPGGGKKGVQSHCSINKFLSPQSACTPSLSRPEGSWISAPTHPLPNSGTWLPCFPASSGAEIPPTTYSTDPGTNATSSRKLAQTPRRLWSFLYGSDCIPDFCPKWYQSVVPQTESSLGPETSLNLLRSPAGVRHVADSKAVQVPHQSG